MIRETLHFDANALARLCRESGVRRLDLFGSRAKGTSDAGSDVDLLIEFAPELTPGLLGFIALEAEFRELLGEKVDLVSAGGLNPYLADEILASRVPLYER